MLNYAGLNSEVIDCIIDKNPLKHGRYTPGTNIPIISFEEGKITEEVIGVKGDFCTKLTEDIENILSHPSNELVTEWKQEYNMQIEDQNIQVLSLSF